jgi:hypothetical protein
MRESFERILLMSDPDILPLRAQAARGAVREPERSQFAHLLRHFLERFFNHETASPDGDAKARIVLAAFIVGLPNFVIALYLWPVYHNYILSLASHHPLAGPPSWLRVNHHFFFVVYSLVALGIATVFEWDMFFPDLLDLFVLTTLPIAARRLFLARVAAIAILIAGFLFDANLLTTLVLPAAIDPPNLPRFLAGHLLAVTSAGLFAAVFILALQSVLIVVFGERLFRRISLFLQGLLIAALLMILLLFPVFSGVVPNLLESGHWYVRWFPPFWFLGIYQRLMEGPAALPIYGQLARTGYLATVAGCVIVVLAYPLAYLRRTRQLIEGGAAHSHRNWLAEGLRRLVNAVIVRSPQQRAIFHYVTQTLLRVTRYRIYLVLYGGVGLSIIVASILRFSVIHNQVRMAISPGGLRASIGIAAFWAIAGLRIAFLSPGNQQASWILHFIHGRPPELPVALEQLRAVKTWALLFVAAITGTVAMFAFAIAPPELRASRIVVAELLVATGFCLILTDLFFLHVTTVAFTGEQTGPSTNPAMSIARYLTFFPIVIGVAVVSAPWIEARAWRYLAILAGLVAAHWLIELRHRELVRQHCLLFDPDGGDNLFLRLDLRDYSTDEHDKKNQAIEEAGDPPYQYEPVYENADRSE